MELITGFRYNIRGLGMGLKTGKLLFWGFVRFAVIILITILTSSLILLYHQDIMGILWAKPESQWILWFWHLLSWLLTLLLICISAIFSYLLSQILFSVLIMDHMSRITEFNATGRVEEAENIPLLRLFLHLIMQEIPRTIIPVGVSVLLMTLGWFTPLGPVLVILSSGTAILFLAWDNTDLPPARQLIPFKQRFGFLVKNLSFHIGFGLPFLIPGLNILFLSFAPVGATLYYIEKKRGGSTMRHQELK